MLRVVRYFSDFLEEKDLNYDIVDGESMKLNIRGKNISSYSIFYFFRDNGKNVSVRTTPIASVQSDHIAHALYICNKMNEHWRWIKFYLDSDNDIIAETDAVLDPHTASDECFELLCRTVDIIDNAYPEIMKTLWMNITE